MPPEEVHKDEKEKHQLLDRYPLAAAYIRWGEKKGYPRRPTLAGRTYWWIIEASCSPLLWWKSIGERYGCLYNPLLLPTDQRNYFVHPSKAIDPIVLLAILNSTIDRLFVETQAREMTGAYTIIELSVEQARRKLTLDPSSFSSMDTTRLRDSFFRLAICDNQSIFAELGFARCRKDRCEHPHHPNEYVHPESLTLQQVQQASPHRFEMDTEIFDALGLTEEERKEVYRAVCQLVWERISKARNV